MENFDVYPDTPRLLTRRRHFEQLTPRKILIVGERPRPGAPEHILHTHIPFGSIVGCSGWLNKKLDEHHIPEEALTWRNAFYFKNQPTDPKVIFWLEPTTIIALGKVAHNWLTKYGWDHHEVPHPQFWKRFKSKEPYPLFDLLGTLL